MSKIFDKLKQQGTIAGEPLKLRLERNLAEKTSR
jgi:hypothetical protein